MAALFPQECRDEAEALRKASNRLAGELAKALGAAEEARRDAESARGNMEEERAKQAKAEAALRGAEQTMARVLDFNKVGGAPWPASEVEGSINLVEVRLSALHDMAVKRSFQSFMFRCLNGTGTSFWITTRLVACVDGTDLQTQSHCRAQTSPCFGAKHRNFTANLSAEDPRVVILSYD